jgi:hypothetical protein
LGTTRSTCEQRDTALHGKFIGLFQTSRAAACLEQIKVLCTCMK